MVELKGRLDTTEERISELEDTSKINQNATQRKKENNSEIKCKGHEQREQT